MRAVGGDQQVPARHRHSARSIAEVGQGDDRLGPADQLVEHHRAELVELDHPQRGGPRRPLGHHAALGEHPPPRRRAERARRDGVEVGAEHGAHRRGAGGRTVVPSSSPGSESAGTDVTPGTTRTSTLPTRNHPPTVWRAGVIANTVAAATATTTAAAASQCSTAPRRTSTGGASRASSRPVAASASASAVSSSHHGAATGLTARPRLAPAPRAGGGSHATGATSRCRARSPGHRPSPAR